MKCIILKNQKETVYYKENGVYYYADKDAEIDLFPSKDQRDWNKWQRPFVDGDILILPSGGMFIYKGISDFGTCKSYCGINCHGDFESYASDNWCRFDTSKRLATEEEKQKLFDAIKANGYEWNAETKTLEKLIVPKFKVGNSIQSKTDNNDKFTITNIDNNEFYYGYGKGHEFIIPVVKQDNWELIPYKFDPKTLKPFDKVLVRTHPDNNWFASFFSHLNYPATFYYKFATTSGLSYKYMIPYNEETKHLLGTSKQAPEFYIC